MASKIKSADTALADRSGDGYTIKRWVVNAIQHLLRVEEPEPHRETIGHGRRQASIDAFSGINVTAFVDSHGKSLPEADFEVTTVQSRSTALGCHRQPRSPGRLRQHLEVHVRSGKATKEIGPGERCVDL
jgi:hypothetical protein